MKVGNNESELRSLLLDSIAGKSDSYRLFLQKLTALLRSYVSRQLRRMGRAQNDVEDIVQEALMAIHTRRHTYQSDLSVTAWAYAITRYKLIDHLRSTKRDTQSVELDEGTAEIDIRESIDASLSVDDVVAKLPKKLRDPIRLIKLEGYSARDVAEVTGTSEVAVRVNLHRALKALGTLVTGKALQNENR